MKDNGICKDLTKEAVVNILKKELPSLAAKYGVRKVALYGSYAKGSQRKGSDIDILVELKKPLGLDFVGLAQALEDKLGKKVDMATFDCYKRSLRNPRRRHIAEDIGKNIIYV